MGFGSKWLGWMWSCLSSAKFSILVNGVPAGFFPSSKGLRQGDPLSPYLFVLGMEVLDALIRRVVAGGFLLGCSIRGGRRTNQKISHLFFADDTVVFCEANKEHLTHLSWILFWFEAASGLRINLDKSEIIPVGVVEEIDEMAEELGCRLLEIRKSTKRFPLGGGNVERKAHLVKWEVVCADKNKGGLGLRKLALLNKALLGKWIWRFACDKDNLWKQVILAKYGQEGHGWRTKKAYGVLRVGVWKEILKATDWCWDTWNATVEEMWDQNFGQGGWNLRFLRDFNDWELDMIEDLLYVLRGYKPSMEEDSICWKGGRNGKFRVKEAYSLLGNPMTLYFCQVVFGWL
ncbi:putative mitochondrial protein [Vitis vinifera]|uniref:Putative mitochondrial protein n=1 Tax=Vitis vinifera TaxID=29760 RepID=A0A438E0C3_VITVI|nr:putative mitochondrial protein [Vitis vinifera]